MQSHSPARSRSLRSGSGSAPQRPSLTPQGAGGALAVLACAVALSCGPPPTANGAERAGAETGAEPAFEGLQRATASKVLTVPLDQREMVRAISTTVNAESETEIDVFPRASGVVVALHAEEGDRVAAGEILLEIDPRAADAALAEANIALREAKDAKRDLELTVEENAARVNAAVLTFEQSERELERKEDAGAIIARNELDLLRLSVATNAADLTALRITGKRAAAALESQDIAIERAQLQVSNADLELSYTKLEAPFAGVIARRDVRVGDLISNAAPAFVLTDPENVRAVVSRPQRELTFFREAEARARKASDGGTVGPDALDIEIEPEALPGSVYSGNIRFVSPTVDPASGQFRVTIGVNQPEEGDERLQVLPGMLLRIRIVTERHPDALVVPKRAMLREGESYFVFVAEEGVARRIRVLEGFASDDFIEVLPVEAGSLKAGDAIVVVGNRDLEDGETVEASVWGVEKTPDEKKAPDDGDETDASGDDDDA